jgi:glycosyltransferase involved in cell wall biosynthesis
MKIAWFTPLSDKSSIGRGCTAVVRELAKLADLEVWHSEAGPKHAVEAKTTYFRDEADPILERLSSFDLIFYNFGNHLPFHREIYLTALQYPGVAILHDFVMHHFFAAYYLEEMRNPERYQAEMKAMYGSRGLAAAKRSLVSPPPVWETDAVTEFPMFEKILPGVRGIITHSDFLLEKVNALRSGPARKIPLSLEVSGGATQAERASLGVPADRLIALTVGHVNPNKRVDAVIEAIAAEPRIHYLIAGPCEPNYRQRLDAMIRKYGLAERVQFLGYVSEEKLKALLTHADICVNLRYPTTEGASGSVIEQMQYGKPVIVTDAGSFSELPPDAVLKIRLQEEQIDLRAALSSLLDEERRLGLGKRARAYVTSTHRPDLYAKEALRFAWEVRNAGPVLGLADRVSGELARMGVTAEMALVDTVSGACADLFFSGRDVSD